MYKELLKYIFFKNKCSNEKVTYLNYGDSQFDMQFFQILNRYKKSQSFLLKKLIKIIPLVLLSSCTTSSKCYFELVDLNLVYFDWCLFIMIIFILINMFKTFVNFKQ
jgi:hypothetical protein